MYLDFLKAYRAWLDEGAVDGDLFVRWGGLCLNMKYYAESKTDNPNEVQDALSTLRGHLTLRLGCCDYPFNGGSGRNYDKESMGEEACHLNPQRIAFVDAEIERLEKQ